MYLLPTLLMSWISLKFFLYGFCKHCFTMFLNFFFIFIWNQIFVSEILLHFWIWFYLFSLSTKGKIFVCGEYYLCFAEAKKLIILHILAGLIIKLARDRLIGEKSNFNTGTWGLYSMKIPKNLRHRWIYMTFWKR